jgi:hypothetical protein
MVTLDTAFDYAWMFLVAATLGAIGGLAYELLLVRRGDTGSLELPRRKGDNRFYDLGFFASMLLGAVAAVAVSYFFTPEVQVVENSEPVTKWEIAKLVPLSLLVGSAGGAFLSAMQARVLATVNETKLETAKRVASEQLDAIAETTKSHVSQAVQVAPESAEASTVQAAATDAIDQNVATCKRAIAAL